MPAEPAWLTIDCEGERRYVRLDLRLTTLGRNENNVVDLPDKRLSRFHCEIERRGEDYLLRDCGSRNGTILNGARIAGEIQLAPGDTVEIGNSKLLFRAERPAAADAGDLAIPVMPLPRTMREALTFKADSTRMRDLDVSSGQTPADAFPIAPGAPQEKFDPRPTMSIPTPHTIRAPHFVLDAWPKLAEGVRRLAEGAPLEALLARVAETAVELAHARQAVVLLPPEEAGGPLRVGAVRPLPPPGTAAPDARYSTSLAERVVASGVPISSLDLASDAEFSSDVSVLGLSLRGAVAVPLRALGRVRGVLSVDEPAVVAEGDRAEATGMLAILGDAAGLALVATQGPGGALAADEARAALEAQLSARRVADALPPASSVEVALRVAPGRGAFAEVASLPERGGRRELALLIGQSSGSPMDVARLEAGARAAFRALSRSGAHPDTYLLAIEDALGADIEGRKLAVALLRLDPLTGEARLACAGLGPLVLRRASGEVLGGSGTGPCLGERGGAEALAARPIPWEAGDLVLLAAPGGVAAQLGSRIAGAPIRTPGEVVERLFTENARELALVLGVRRAP